VTWRSAWQAQASAHHSQEYGKAAANF
jgi:hypothetical protein